MSNGNVLTIDYIYKLFNSIKSICENINSLYEQDDIKNILFIFLGSSPAYLYYYFKLYYSKYNIILIPLSGLSLIFEHNYYPVVSIVQQQKFCEYIRRFIPVIDFNKIVIIDHSHTGKSINNLIKLIKECTEFNRDINIEFCNLVDNITHNLSIIPPSYSNIKIIIIKGECINDMSGHIVPRLTQQIHFTTIINKTIEEIVTLLEDKTTIAEGLVLLKILKL